MIAYIDTNAVIWLSDGRTRPSSHETIRLTDLAELLISPMVVLELELLDQILRIKQSAPDVQTKIDHELGVQSAVYHPKNSSYLTKVRQFRGVFSVGAG
jgi:PIN domain nuclease of toxin-antitoxin system